MILTFKMYEMLNFRFIIHFDFKSKNSAETKKKLKEKFMHFMEKVMQIFERTKSGLCSYVLENTSLHAHAIDQLRLISVKLKPDNKQCNS